MIFPSHSSPVPPFHSLESGTMEQTLNQRNSSRNVNGTFSLKALAKKVLEQNKKGNKPGTAASKSVPPRPQSSSACGTNAEVGCKGEADNFLYEFNERAAIMEYESVLTREKTEKLNQNKEKIKIAAEKETSTDSTDRFKTNANVSVLSVPTGGVLGQNSFYPYEERLAIAEVDGNQNPIQAHRIAYLDAFITLLSALAEDDPHQDWLAQKIQTALATLEALRFSTLH